VWGGAEGEEQADPLLSVEPNTGAPRYDLSRSQTGEAGFPLSREPSVGLDPRTLGP